MAVQCTSVTRTFTTPISQQPEMLAIQMSEANVLRVMPGRREAILGQPSTPPAEIAASTGTRVGRVDRVRGAGRRRW